MKHKSMASYSPTVLENILSLKKRNFKNAYFHVINVYNFFLYDFKDSFRSSNPTILSRMIGGYNAWVPFPDIYIERSNSYEFNTISY